MDFKLKKHIFAFTMITTFIFTASHFTFAACNAPLGKTCTFTLKAVDKKDPSRFATDGGALQMVGRSRKANITATSGDNATFDENKPSWSNGKAGISFLHSGGNITYTAKAFGVSKSISIEEKDGGETSVSLKGNAGFKTIASALNGYAEKLGIGVKAMEPTVTGSYKWKYVDKKNSPNIAKYHTITVDCSAGIEWEEVGLPGLSKTIDLGAVEIKCGVYCGGDISLSVAGTSTYDPNSDKNIKNSIVAKVSGTVTLRLQGSAEVDTWFLTAGAGAEVSGNFNLGASAGAIIGESGINSSEAKLTYSVSLEGKAYVYVNGKHWERSWIYAPKSLQGEQPFSFNYNFGE